MKAIDNKRRQLNAYEQQMAVVANALDTMFNGGATGDKRRTGFVLLVFPYGVVDGNTNYISNGADRRDVITLMKELIARLEGQA